MLEREHVNSQGTLAREHVSTQEGNGVVKDLTARKRDWGSLNTKRRGKVG